MTGADLLHRAKALLPLAKAPYSGFRVAAVLLDDRGEPHPGVNVESASLGLTMCAERNALYGAIARGAGAFRRIAIVSEKEAPVLPCGACRQLLLEYAPDLIVVVESASGGVEDIPLRDLLPRPFLSYPSGP